MKGWTTRVRKTLLRIEHISSMMLWTESTRYSVSDLYAKITQKNLKKVLTMPLTGAIITFADAARKEKKAAAVAGNLLQQRGG